MSVRVNPHESARTVDLVSYHFQDRRNKVKNKKRFCTEKISTDTLPCT